MRSTSTSAQTRKDWLPRRMGKGAEARATLVAVFGQVKIGGVWNQFSAHASGRYGRELALKQSQQSDGRPLQSLFATRDSQTASGRNFGTSLEKTLVRRNLSWPRGLPMNDYGRNC